MDCFYDFWYWFGGMADRPSSYYLGIVRPTLHSHPFKAKKSILPANKVSLIGSFATNCTNLHELGRDKKVIKERR